MNKTDLQGRYLGNQAKAWYPRETYPLRFSFSTFGFSTRRKLKGSK